MCTLQALQCYFWSACRAVNPVTYRSNVKSDQKISISVQNLGSSRHASVVRVLDQTISSLTWSYFTNLEGLLWRTTSILTLKLWPSLQCFKIKRNVKKGKLKISNEISRKPILTFKVWPTQLLYPGRHIYK